MFPKSFSRLHDAVCRSFYMTTLCVEIVCYLQSSKSRAA